MLVVAGAGSGKTRVLTHRVAHLINAHGIKPQEILAITFTNKAAGEMRERLEDMLGGVARSIWILTFRSACGRILRREAPREEGGPVRLVDDQHRDDLLRAPRGRVPGAGQHREGEGRPERLGRAAESLLKTD